MNSKGKIAVVATFILFFLLFNAPFLTMPKGMVGSVPSIMIYIGVFWIILIFLMRMIFFKKENNNKS